MTRKSTPNPDDLALAKELIDRLSDPRNPPPPELVAAFESLADAEARSMARKRTVRAKERSLARGVLYLNLANLVQRTQKG